MRKPTRLALQSERQRLQQVWRQHQADLETWRHTLRPCFLHLFAQGAATLRWSRTLLTLLVDELQTEDRVFELVGDLRRLPVRRYPQAIAVAIALRHSWRPDDLALVARRLGITLSVTALSRRSRSRRSHGPHASAAHPSETRVRQRPGHHARDSRARRRAVKALRFAPTPFGAGGLDSGVGRAQRWLLRDGPRVHPRKPRSSRS
jgi:hypothetical protein